MEAELSVAIRFKDIQLFEPVVSYFMQEELSLDVSPATSDLMEEYLDEVEYPEVVDLDIEALIIAGEWILGGGNWFAEANALLISIQKVGGVSASAILSIDGEPSGRFYYLENGEIEFEELQSVCETEEVLESDEYEDGFRVLAKQHLVLLNRS